METESWAVSMVMKAAEAALQSIIHSVKMVTHLKWGAMGSNGIVAVGIHTKEKIR